VLFVKMPDFKKGCRVQGAVVRGQDLKKGAGFHKT